MEGDAKQAFDFTKESARNVGQWVEHDNALTDLDREAITCAQNSLGATIASAGVRAGKWTEEEASELLTTHTHMGTGRTG